ncbi:DNA primase [Leadbettera azotonutricia]|uniref:Putative DNA primase n=1 Tax=Leadbettera azotonutricia (strain ATCC BAA-888 / DSM 13862 / ZAS-9) TaxID=545695 RepID=F5YBJ0_LEAAZ|nr:DNA primase [Leadbettera azotonutricia]AEF83189.1 putative DNA primase [Leadbettera azotonutricia ZAS-9]
MNTEVIKHPGMGAGAEAKNAQGGNLEKSATDNLQQNTALGKSDIKFLKSRLAEYLDAKGIHPNEQGLIICLWHDEHNPSCKVNPEYAYCFTCHESGDIFAVSAALAKIPCDKDHFPQIVKDIENTLGIVTDWKPPKGKRPVIRLSQSTVYRDSLLREFADALDSGDMSRARLRAEMLLALFMLPEPEAPKEAKPRRTMADRLAASGIQREAWTL